MSLSILNSISSLVAENSLNQTAAAQQKTLQQLSTGLKINSSADDAAGLVMATGLQANTAALAQSTVNANNGISFLQVADGALSQVNTLLNRAVTLATESASSGLTSQQRSATDTEYQSILTEINQIGATTQFNGTQVFNNASSSAVSLSNNGATVTGTINPADTLSGGFNVTSTVPAVAGTTSGVSTSDSGGNSTTATITPGATISGDLTINATVPAVSPSTSDITLTDNVNGTISGNIDPTTSLSGDLVVSATVPGTSGGSTVIGLSNSNSTTIAGTVNPADTLSGGLTITSTGTAAGSDTSNVTFSVTGSGTSQAITSSAITTGATLSGSLTINSTGVYEDAGAATLNLANYQGLASSNAATATAAANKLASDLTNDLWSMTDINYSASISGGVLTIHSANPGDSQSIDMSGAGNSLTSAVSLVTGDILGGTINITSHMSETALNFSSYQGLTSSNAATVSATLTQLGQDITGQLSNTYTYTAYIDSSGKLVINSSNPNDDLTDLATETETPSGDPAGELLSVGSNGVQQTTPSYGTTTANITFSVTGSGTSQAITSSVITTGATLSGSLTINSTGVYEDAGAATLNLANYQGLASSNAATATAAANKLASDLTNDLWSMTDINYSASISGGVLTIHSANPGDSQSIDMSGAGNSLTSAVSLVTGDILGGTINITSHMSETALNFSSYQGLTSSNAATVSATLTQLGQDITGQLSNTYTYTAYIDSSGKLVINSSNPNDDLTDLATETETPSGDPAGELLSVGGGYAQQTYSLAPVLTPTSVNLNGTTTANLQSALQSALGSNYSVSYNTGSGALNITVSAAGLAAGVTSIATTSNSAQETSGGTSPVTTPTSVDITGQTGTTLGSYLSSQLGQDYSVAYNQTTGALSISISSYGANTDGIGSIAAGTGSAQETTAGSPQVITPKTVSLTGVATTNLESYLQAQLGGDYSVSYDQGSGALAISLISNNPDGYISFASSSSATQTVGYVAPINTSAIISLAGLTETNLASSLLSQLNSSASDYTVSYDQTTGALSIGISGAGNTAGITSIASSNNTAQQTASGGTSGSSVMDVFTSDGTTGGNAILDITVGSLTTANLGTINGNAGVDMTGSALLTQSSSTSALALITTAINDISGQRGVVGANVNRLQATANDIQTEDTNLTSATNSIMNADIGKTVANMTQYNILQSTGMAALQQSNQAQQDVLKLVQ